MSGTACLSPSNIPNYDNTKLPNPFLFNDGRPVRTQLDWVCRRQQIHALVQGYEAGSLPGKPQYFNVVFSRNGTVGNLTVTTGPSREGSVSFSSMISFPPGDPPRTGWPLLIGLGGGSIPIPDSVRAEKVYTYSLELTIPQVALLAFQNSIIGEQNSPSSRGVGLFFELYGSNATASAMTAWVWGVSRIIDALEVVPQAHINTKRIGVTGCSRNGKGALMVGAFEQRIALTIPQESGSGGDTCWRLSKFEQDNGQVVQEAVEIVQENVWFSQNFENFVHRISELPYDHHLLAGMIAPRPMISYENTDFEWLSPLSAFGCMTAAHSVWRALGVPERHGFVQVGGHAHCAFPESLKPTLNAFIDRFLLDRPVNTSIFETNGQFAGVQWVQSNWTDWNTPRLL